ncbi:hypothetical protein DFH09DRAFT_1301006 [Mycena vulgaris]|nr:hypothetical protein DFH09DRAFT_1301006 [Mycena vulgaris]
MSGPLASLAYGSDFKLGSQSVNAAGEITSVYVDTLTGAAVQALVVGVVLGVIDVGNGVHLIVLESPGESSPILRAMFEEQAGSLGSVLAADASDTSRLVIHRQHWSQGASRGGAVYVTVGEYTTITRNDASLNSAAAPFDGIASEVPLMASAPESEVEPGALMVFNVDMRRVDAVVADGLGSSERSMYARAYILRASDAVRFLRIH